MNTNPDPMNRRDFIKSSGIAAISAAAITPSAASAQTPPAENAGLESALKKALEAATEAKPAASPVAGAAGVLSDGALDLSPAKWLWYPGDRTLAEYLRAVPPRAEAPRKARKATGWIIGDSRYLLEMNGRRIQWGPAPNDPRWPEVDHMDLTEALTTGENVIGATVLYFGHGDSTWPMGRAGFIFKLEIEHADGRRETVVSDNTSWRCHLSQAWKPGHHRTLVHGCLAGGVRRSIASSGMDGEGLRGGHRLDRAASSALPGATYRSSADPTNDVMTGIHGPKKFIYGAESRSKMELRPRSIPLMRETWVGIAKLSEQHRIRWKRPIEEFFAMRPPKAYEAELAQAAKPAGESAWRVELDPDRGTTLTFALHEQMVGWPAVTIEAPAGTTWKS